MNNKKVFFTYRWQIPKSLMDDFRREWQELTQINISKYGLVKAELFMKEPDIFISLTVWPDEASWKRWKEADSHHEYRERWRPYRVEGPEKINLEISI